MKRLKWLVVAMIWIAITISLSENSFAARGFDQRLGSYRYDDIWLDEPKGFKVDHLYELTLDDNVLTVTFSRYRKYDSTYEYENLQPGRYRFYFTKQSMNKPGGAYNKTWLYYDDGHIAFTINDDGQFEDVYALEPQEGTSVYATGSTIRYRGEFEYYDNFNCTKGGCFPRWYLSVYFNLNYQSQSPPTLDILSDSNTNVYANYEGYSQIQVEGYVQDLDNDPVTVTVTIDGVTKSQTIQQTQVARLFSIPFDVIADNISGGEHIVEITADDTYYKGRVTKTYPIKVASIVGANRYVLVDTPLLYFTEYSDYENDPLYEQQFRYIHDEHYFDNSLGKIPDSGIWRHRYESLSKPGHYQIDFRNRDNPKDDHRFDEFRKWSPASAVLDLYVHRKPIANIDVFLDREDRYATYYDLKVVSSSYDLDHQSKPGAGIAQEQWSWKYEEDSEWTPGKPPGTIHRTSTVYVQLIVQDIEGAWSDPAIRIINPSGTYLPIAGFTVEPRVLFRNQLAKITSTAGHERANEPITHQYYIQPDGQEEYAYTTEADWTISFPEEGVYTIRQVVTDRNGYSAQHIETVTVSNRLPVVEVTTPGSSSAANPTEYEYEEPVIIHWTYNDPDNDPQTRYQLQIIQHSNNQVLFDSGQVSSSDRKRQVHDLPRGETLRVQVRAYDGTDWSAWSEPKYLYIIDNQPPIADFTWSPNPVYEGDTITLLDQSSDPDGDALTYQWTVTGPNGYRFNGTNKAFAIPGKDTENRTGTYSVKLTVRDPKGLSDSVTKTITVNPLGIKGYVQHTEEWNENREGYNRKHKDNPRPYEYFWAGERFILKANTTETETQTKAEKVTVVMRPYRGSSYRATLEPTDSDQTLWYGELYEDGFDHLPDGEAEFEFTVRYSNGVIKKDVVTVVIDGNWTDYFQLHRVK